MLRGALTKLSTEHREIIDLVTRSRSRSARKFSLSLLPP